MGCGSSSSPAADRPHRSTGADEASPNRKDPDGPLKVLLLGPDGAGKSTVFKQMRFHRGAELSDDELRTYGVAVRSNIVTATRELIRRLRDMGLEGELDRESREEKGIDDGEGRQSTTLRHAYDELATVLVENPIEDAAPAHNEGGDEDWVGTFPRAGYAPNLQAKLFLAHHESIQTLWQSKTIKQVWADRTAFDIIDSHKEYLDDVPRIASSDYKPTTRDVLLARVKTTQVNMERYHYEDADYEISHGLAQQRWLKCLDQFDFVVFVADLSDYDRTSLGAGAEPTNRMVETLELFRSVCAGFNGRDFSNTAILLFLNKKDLFAEKILESDIAEQGPFRGYSGPAKDCEHGVRYFIEKFKDCANCDRFNDQYILASCATDVNNMEFILDSAWTMWHFSKVLCMKQAKRNLLGKQ